MHVEFDTISKYNNTSVEDFKNIFKNFVKEKLNFNKDNYVTIRTHHIINCKLKSIKCRDYNFYNDEYSNPFIILTEKDKECNTLSKLYKKATTETFDELINEKIITYHTTYCDKDGIKKT